MLAQVIAHVCYIFNDTGHVAEAGPVHAANQRLGAAIIADRLPRRIVLVPLTVAVDDVVRRDVASRSDGICSACGVVRPRWRGTRSATPSSAGSTPGEAVARITAAALRGHPLGRTSSTNAGSSRRNSRSMSMWSARSYARPLANDARSSVTASRRSPSRLAICARHQVLAPYR